MKRNNFVGILAAVVISLLVMSGVFSVYADEAVGFSKNIKTRLNGAIVLYQGNPRAVVNNGGRFIDTNEEVVPVTKNQTTLVPVRFISEKLGAKVAYDQKTKLITISMKGKIIKMNVGKSEMTVNGKRIKLAVPATSYNQRTFVPLRAVSEAFGKKVFYDRGLIVISSKDAIFNIATEKAMIDEVIKWFNSYMDNDSMTVFAQARHMPESDKYNMNMTINDVDKTLNGTQHVTYVNKENVPLNEIYFHVYANVFSKKEKIPAFISQSRNIFRDGFKPGNIEFTSVRQVGSTEKKPLKYSISGADGTIMKVSLPEALKPGENVVIEMRFGIQVPMVSDRFGYGKGSYSFGNWYPIAAVYDETGWNLDSYHGLGDPFYSDIADYTVKIRLPKDYTVAASGIKVYEGFDPEGKVWNFEAEKMRDFAFTANTRYDYVESQIGNTTIRSYYYSGQEQRGEEALIFAEESIMVYNRLFGEYPYKSFSVVETSIDDGMEYPGLVYIGDQYYDGADEHDSDLLLMVIMHETAHQWWYGIVGNDQIDEAWLDEGFATYSEILFGEEEFGKDVALEYYEGNVKSRITDPETGAVAPNKVLRSLDKYTDWDDYNNSTYRKGALILDEIRKQVGDDVFLDIMKNYYETYKYKIATTEDFINICEQASGKNLREIIEKLLN